MKSSDLLPRLMWWTSPFYTMTTQGLMTDQDHVIELLDWHIGFTYSLTELKSMRGFFLEREGGA